SHSNTGSHCRNWYSRRGSSAKYTTTSAGDTPPPFSPSTAAPSTRTPRPQQQSDRRTGVLPVVHLRVTHQQIPRCIKAIRDLKRATGVDRPSRARVAGERKVTVRSRAGLAGTDQEITTSAVQA